MTKKRDRSTSARKARQTEVELAEERRAKQDRENEEERQARRAQAFEDIENPDLTFDFSQLTWEDSEEIQDIQFLIQEAVDDNDRDKLREAYALLRDWLAQVTTSVPREWFVDRAPDKLDLTDPDTYKWLKDVRVSRLRDALAVARENAEKK